MEAIMQYIGIDVSETRGQAAAVMNDDLVITRLMAGMNSDHLFSEIIGKGTEPLIVAIDSPRSPAPGTGKFGRQCERDLHRLEVRPQWTPTKSALGDPANESRWVWMRIGFDLFRQASALKDEGLVEEVIEVFPSASYGRFPEIHVHMPIGQVLRKAKTDQLDAVCCAMTAWCFAHKQFMAVGDPQEGQIIVPALINNDQG